MSSSALEATDKIVEVEGEALLTARSSQNWRSNVNHLRHGTIKNVPFIHVPSRRHELLRIARAINEGRPVLVRGPMGCGKTRLLQYLAEITKHDDEEFYRVHMSDQVGNIFMMRKLRL